MENLSKEQHEAFVKLTIDGLVLETGMPAVGFALIESNVTDKKTLRRMVRKGTLRVVRVSAGQGNVTTYHSDDVIPTLLQEKKEGTNATERAGLEHHQLDGLTSEVDTEGNGLTEEDGYVEYSSTQELIEGFNNALKEAGSERQWENEGGTIHLVEASHEDPDNTWSKCTCEAEEYYEKGCTCGADEIDDDEKAELALQEWYREEQAAEIEWYHDREAKDNEDPSEGGA